MTLPLDRESYPSFDDKEAETRRQTIANHQEDIALLQRVLNDFLLGFDALHGYKTKHQNEGLMLTLCVKAFNSMKCAHDNLLNGYYAQCLTLVRTVEEDWLTCLYVHKHPDKARLWLGNRRTPSFQCMRCDLEEELRRKTSQSYGILSTFAHPRARALAVSMNRTQGRISPRLGGKYDADHFIAAIYMLIPAALNMLGIVAVFLHDTQPAWFERITTTRDDAIAWVQSVNQKVARRPSNRMRRS